MAPDGPSSRIAAAASPMLSPQAPALDREQAIALLEELQAVQARLERLRSEFRRLAEE